MDLATFAFGFGASVAVSALAVLFWRLSRREPSKAVLVKRLDHAGFTYTQRMSPEQVKAVQEAMRGGKAATFRIGRLEVVEG